jgi:hypothetical protein
MHVIGHNHVRAQFHVGNMFGDGAPAFVGDIPEIVQLHFPSGNFTKQASAMAGDDRHKVRARLRIIVTCQADRPPVVDFGIELGTFVRRHVYCLSGMDIRN